MRYLRKVLVSAVAAFSLLVPSFVQATVSATVGPTSLVTAPMKAKASSSQIGLFSFTLTQDAGESLSSVAVTISNAGTSVATGSDFASVSVYKDDGDGNFEPGTDDLQAGTQTTVNVGSATTVTTGANNTIAVTPGSKFFVSMATGASWSDAAPSDSVAVNLAASGILTSANSPTVTAVTTDTITADTTAPTLSSAMAKNTGGTNAKEAGDSIELLFSESTNKPAVNAGNIASMFTLNNAHSFLDGAALLGSASWSVDGKKLTIVISAGTSLASVNVGDLVTVAGSSVTDISGNAASGSVTISGSFAGQIGDDDGDDDGDQDEDEDEDEGRHGVCANSLINGRLYKIGVEATVYLSASCRLKPFRGAAVFHARGHKFQNIIMLGALPANVTISDKPVLPAEGTLVKGKNKTVWFVDEHGKKRGFVSANVFVALGFSFGSVQEIADTDLALITEGDNVSDSSQHPDGALFICGGSAAVFEVIGGVKFPFASAEAFESRGHSFTHILLIDCGRFRYLQGAPVTST